MFVDNKPKPWHPGQSGPAALTEHAMHAVRDGEMHVLDLGNNSISREGASALAKYMAKSKTLRELNVYMNDFGTAGITEARPAAIAYTLILD